MVIKLGYNNKYREGSNTAGQKSWKYEQEIKLGALEICK